MPARPLRTAEADVTGCADGPQRAPLACTLASVGRWIGPGPVLGINSSRADWGGSLAASVDCSRARQSSRPGAIFAADCDDNPAPSHRGLVYLREMGRLVVTC